MRAGQEWSESFEGVDCGAGFAAGSWDPLGVEDDAAVDVFGAGGDEDELGAPGGFAGAFEVQAGVGFAAFGEDLAGVFVDPGVVGFGAVEGGDDFAVGVDHAIKMRMCP